MVHVARLGTQLAQRPRDAALLADMGLALLRLGHERGAERCLLQALHLNPRDATVHAALAAFYDRTGDRQRAARHRALAVPKP
jgi:Flp pilus assembly protein TadD